MKAISNIALLGLFVALTSMFTLSSCGEKAQDAAGSAVATPDSESIISTRGNNSAAKAMRMKAAAIAEYNATTMATFEKGNMLVQMNLEDYADIDGKQVSVVVLYESSAPWAEPLNQGDFSKTGDDTLNGLLASYDLSITKHFELDDFNNGIVLKPNSELVSDAALEATREISMVDYVMMVHLKEPSSATPGPEEAASK